MQLKTVTSFTAISIIGLLASCSSTQSGLPTTTTPQQETSTSQVVTTTTSLATTTTEQATTTAVAPTTTLPPTTIPPTTTTIEKIPALEKPLEVFGRNAKGDQVKALQYRLLDLGFWVDEVDGEYGAVTSQAVMAFQKMYKESHDLKANGKLDENTVNALNTIDTRAVATILEGDLIEVDKGRQLLFIIRGGKTLWVLNTSTGSGKRYTEENKKEGGTITDVAITRRFIQDIQRVVKRVGKGSTWRALPPKILQRRRCHSRVP
jgi:hypothetical protein